MSSSAAALPVPLTAVRITPVTTCNSWRRAAAGIDRSYLSQLENDRKSPTVDNLFHLYAALGVKASVIIARVEREQREVAE